MQQTLCRLPCRCAFTCAPDQDRFITSLGMNNASNPAPTGVSSGEICVADSGNICTVINLHMRMNQNYRRGEE